MGANNGNGSRLPQGEHESEGDHLARLLIVNAKKAAKEAAAESKAAFESEAQRMMARFAGLIEAEHITDIEGARDKALEGLKEYVAGVRESQPVVEFDLAPLMKCVETLGSAIKELQITNEVDTTPFAEAHSKAIAMLVGTRQTIAQCATAYQEQIEANAALSLAVALGAEKIVQGLAATKTTRRIIDIERDRDGRMTRAIVTEG